VDSLDTFFCYHCNNRLLFALFILGEKITIKAAFGAILMEIDGILVALS